MIDPATEPGDYSFSVTLTGTLPFGDVYPTASHTFEFVMVPAAAWSSTTFNIGLADTANDPRIIDLNPVDHSDGAVYDGVETLDFADFTINYPADTKLFAGVADELLLIEGKVGSSFSISTDPGGEIQRTNDGSPLKWSLLSECETTTF